MPDVRMPDGTIIRNVPANATREQILGAYQRARQAGAVPDTRPTSFWQGVGEEALRVARRTGDALDSINPVKRLADAVLGAFGSDQGKVTQTLRQRTDAKYAASPNRGSTAGKVVGGIAATLPAMLLPGGPAVQGAASGAMLSHSNSVGGTLRDAAIGGALGVAGDKAVKALGSVIGGRAVSPNVRLLADEGVTMTPGMRAGPGSVRNFVEDKVLGTVAPWIPNSAAGRAEGQLRAAVANRVLAPIGESLPKGTPINSQTIAPLQERVYSALDNAAGNLSLQVDPALTQGLQGVVGASPRLVGDEGARQVAANVDHITQLAGQTPASGQTLRDLLGELRKAASSAQGGMRDQLWSVHDNVVDALARQNSGDAVNAFNNARESATLLARLNDAAAKSVNGEFGPTQLLQAARRRGFGTSTGNVASGEARLMDIANAAADVMRNKTANSGTPSRGIAAALLMGGPSAIGAVNPYAGAAVGSQLLGYIPGIADILQRFALNRPQVLQALGSGVKGAAPLVGYGVAATAPNLVAP